MTKSLHKLTKQPRRRTPSRTSPRNNKHCGGGHYVAAGAGAAVLGWLVLALESSASSRNAWARTGDTAVMPSRTPPVLPGRLMIRVRPRAPASGRDSIAACSFCELGGGGGEPHPGTRDSGREHGGGGKGGGMGEGGGRHCTFGVAYTQKCIAAVRGVTARETTGAPNCDQHSSWWCWWWWLVVRSGGGS